MLDGVIARIPNDFDGFSIDVERISRLRQHRAGRGSLPRNGACDRTPLDAQVAHVWDFRDGKAVHWQQYTDTWQFAQLMGVPTGKAAAAQA